MQKVKYTYQDWVDDNVKHSTYGNISLFGRLYLLGDTSSEDSARIAIEQNQAFLHYLDTAFEAIKRTFIAEYTESVLKHEFLHHYISGFKQLLDTIKIEHELIATKAFYPSSDGRFELTKADVDIYLSAKVDSEDMEIFAWGFMSDIEDAGIEFSKEEKAPLMYILRSNFYNWLLWFKEQQELKNLEPNLKIDSDNLPIGIANLIGKEQESYTWQSNPEEELPELYQHLLDKQLIHSDTTLEQFEAVFKAQPLHKVKTQPIKWHDNNASELLYFITQLEDSGNVDTNGRANYKRLKACFVKSDGQPFTSAFKSLKQKLDIELSDSKKQTIDKIILEF